MKERLLFILAIATFFQLALPIFVAADDGQSTLGSGPTQYSSSVDLIPGLFGDFVVENTTQETSCNYLCKAQRCTKRNGSTGGFFCTSASAECPNTCVSSTSSLPQSSGAIPVSRGAYKIGENESPIPQNRAFLNTSYYTDVDGQTDTLLRTVIGFEKTLFNDDLSVGVRVPFFRLEFDDGNDKSKFDDISLILKWAALRSSSTQSLLSTGLVVTPPTGPASLIKENGESIRSTLIQPYVGYLLDLDPWYIQGFSAVLFPTESEDVTILFNDLGFGNRWRLGGETLTSIAATFEAHLNTPLTNRGEDEEFRFRDSLDLTAGAHLVFWKQMSVGLAIATPVSSPRLFNMELIGNLNWHF